MPRDRDRRSKGGADGAPASGSALAGRMNRSMVEKLELQARPEGAVLKYCLEGYTERLRSGGPEHPLHDLTRHLTGARERTAMAIRSRMEQKWKDDDRAAELVAGSVANSLRRSAGTNYQALVTYALARYLLERESNWYILHPVPKDWAHRLSIRFTGAPVAPDGCGIPSGPVPGGGAEEPAATAGLAPSELPPSAEGVRTGQGDDGAAPPNDGPPAAMEDHFVTVKPDLDILIRNAAWLPGEGRPGEPILVLSVKTSLVDRAGLAARWKMYFDLVTTPCSLHGEEGCAYRRLGIELANAPSVEITHGIVTANIYKVESDPHFAERGELHSNQARANTFMFDHRFTTREESAAVMAEGWASLTELPRWLKEASDRHGLPPEPDLGE